jgi:hypothetical protein
MRSCKWYGNKCRPKDKRSRTEKPRGSKAARRTGTKKNYHKVGNRKKIEE